MAVMGWHQHFDKGERLLVDAESLMNSRPDLATAMATIAQAHLTAALLMSHPTAALLMRRENEWA